MQAGDQAHDSDVWMRVLTNPDWLKKDGTIHNSAFSGKRAIAPPASESPWSLEMSGRLLSLVKNVEDESKAFCVPPLVFSGLIFHKVEALRGNGLGHHKPTGIPTDVRYTPRPADDAHSDLTAYGPEAEDKHILRDWLQDFLQACRPEHCGNIEALRITIQTHA